jgi:hypothetical protein
VDGRKLSLGRGRKSKTVSIFKFLFFKHLNSPVSLLFNTKISSLSVLWYSKFVL